MAKQKFPTFLLKLLISVGLIAFFLWKIDLFRFLEAVRSTRIVYLLIGFVLFPLGQIVCAVKWQYLARALGVHRGLKPMVGLYFIGMFFNLFLPTGIGGDITRGLYLNPDAGKARSFLSVLVERATGLLSMILLASVVLLTRYGAALPDLLRYGFPVATFFLLVFLWFLPRLVGGTKTRMQQLINRDLIVFWKKPQIAIIAIGYSVLIHCILVAIHVCIALALSLPIPIPYHFVTIALASLASLLPSFNGIGVRDGAYIYLLSRIGIEHAFALLFSVLWFIIMTTSSLIGFVVYMTRGLSWVPATQVVDQPFLGDSHAEG